MSLKTESRKKWCTPLCTWWRCTGLRKLVVCKSSRNSRRQLSSYRTRWLWRRTSITTRGRCLTLLKYLGMMMEQATGLNQTKRLSVFSHLSVSATFLQGTKTRWSKRWWLIRRSGRSSKKSSSWSNSFWSKSKGLCRTGAKNSLLRGLWISKSKWI